MRRRVVITGIGLVTPLGVGTTASWAALCRGRSGVGPITRFDASGFDTRIAAEVRGFKAADFLPRKLAARAEPFVAFACAAARMALDDAGLSIGNPGSERIAVVAGCAMGGLSLLETNCRTVSQRGPRWVSPFFVPMMISNMAAGIVAMDIGVRGPNLTFSTACAAGTHAVGEAARMIRAGQVDAAIAGGTEAVVAPTCIAGFAAMRALSTCNEAPEQASRPFDRKRDGFVVGEGAGFLILERLDQALARGARIYAEVAGYGSSCDAHHLTQPPPDADGAIRCMRAALADAGLGPGDIDYINAHGTGTPLNDALETLAIKSVFGERAHAIPVSASKSMTGHLIGAAGGVEAAFCALAIRNATIPPTINLEHPDPACDLDYVPHAARQATITTAMSNSFGFGGTNATLVLQAWRD
ncbi:MAG TPA: beta-ketoacyl-[acyl-carrier-protein] synthase II [Desulfobacteraceae bacterium]|nr:beta-ketoacyl-ACP synthase II [Deltaproteobacteria bacterium]HDI60742.1 beta-ketoacyl-[acyl-carrier-protein] synthase II [Desulfobacteraceae bacterium]